MLKIKFGTSGWRAVISDEFTFRNLKLVTQAIVNYLKTEKLEKRGIVVGYDTRFLSEEFAKQTVEVIAGNKITAYLSTRDIPTPVLSFDILNRKAGGGINITASHNPPIYNGIKFSPAWAGPALPETTQKIEQEIDRLINNPKVFEMSIDEAKQRNLLKLIDPQEDYLKYISCKIDFDLIKKSGLKIIVDPLYGTSRGYLDTILERTGGKVEVINNYRDPYFGGFLPEPAEENISDLISEVRKSKAQLGLATDGDGDRFGIVDEDGTVISPNQIISMLLVHLLKTRNWSGGVARSVATTHLIDAIAKKHNLEVYETPVGFKYIGKLIAEDKLIIGGEESAGLSIKGHVPEKDGILACLLVAEMVALEKKSLQEILYNIYQEFGTYLTRRIDLKLTDELKKSVAEKMENISEKFAGLKIKMKKNIDGTKIILEDDSWMLIRLSGTEPIVRLYVEAPDEIKMKKLIKAGEELIYS